MRKISQLPVRRHQFCPFLHAITTSLSLSLSCSLSRGVSENQSYLIDVNVFFYDLHIYKYNLPFIPRPPIFVTDERISLIGNTDTNMNANYIESILSLCRTPERSPSPPALIYLPTREITTADKTRGMPSKGAYIYETFGKQMDKSNIFEAKWPKLLENVTFIFYV